jgi:LysM repeat protein
VAVELVAPSPISASSPVALVEGKKLLDAGRLVEGRKTVNDALVGGQLTAPGDIAAAKALIREANKVLVYSPQRVEGDPYVDVVTIQKGDKLTRIANDHFCTYEMILKINGLESDRRLRPGQQLKVIKGPMHAVVDKRAFTLDLYLGAPGGPEAMYVWTYRVGLGTDNSTPAGLWKVERGNKLKNPTYYSPRGEGVIAAGDPANPLGPYWVGLTGVEGAAMGKMSYGIHGTIHPDSIGKMESMGCIRLVNEDIAQVFISLYEVKSYVRVVE